MGRVLRGMGFEVVTSRDYAEAEGLYQRRQGGFDMVVADVSLPGNYGCELAKSALQSNPEVTVLFISGNAGAEACKFYGIEPTDMHFLKKPFSDSALATRVRQLLEPVTDRPKEAAARAAGAGTSESELPGEEA